VADVSSGQWRDPRVSPGGLFHTGTWLSHGKVCGFKEEEWLHRVAGTPRKQLPVCEAGDWDAQCTWARGRVCLSS
jgi:hypothetical protein